MKEVFFVLGAQRGIIQDNKQKWGHVHILGPDQGRDQADKIGYMPSQQTCDFEALETIRKHPLPCYLELEMTLRPMKKGVAVIVTGCSGVVQKPSVTPSLKAA